MRSLSLLVLLLSSACIQRPPCNAADELDAIEAGQPTCTTLRAEEKARQRRAFGDGLIAMGAAFDNAPRNETPTYVAPTYQAPRNYTVRVGGSTYHCTENALGNTKCH